MDLRIRIHASGSTPKCHGSATLPYRLEEAKLQQQQPKRPHDEGDSPPQISKNKQKRLDRNPHKAFSKARQHCKLCVGCRMPAGLSCGQDMCKRCCKVSSGPKEGYSTQRSSGFKGSSERAWAFRVQGGSEHVGEFRDPGGYLPTEHAGELRAHMEFRARGGV
jgi:hypothetical protein